MFNIQEENEKYLACCCPAGMPLPPPSYDNLLDTVGDDLLDTQNYNLVDTGEAYG